MAKTISKLKCAVDMLIENDHQKICDIVDKYFKYQTINIGEKQDEEKTEFMKFLNCDEQQELKNL